jgi:hypothetical protein
MAELNISEARKIYNYSDSMKELMLTKFTKEELEVSQSEFDKKFMELLGLCTKTVFFADNGNISKLPTNRIQLRNIDDKWLFDIMFTGKYKHFWASSERIWNIFEDEYNLQYSYVQQLMKNYVERRLELIDVRPVPQRDTLT